MCIQNFSIKIKKQKTTDKMFNVSAICSSCRWTSTPLEESEMAETVRCCNLRTGTPSSDKLLAGLRTVVGSDDRSKVAIAVVCDLERLRAKQRQERTPLVWSDTRAPHIPQRTD